MSEYTPVHMYSGVMAYIGGERKRNMTVEAEKFAHTSQSLRENRNISVYARARPRQVLRGFVADINY